MRALRTWRRRVAVLVALPVLGGVGLGFTASGNTTAPSSVGAGTGHVTVTTTGQGGLSMRTTPFSAP
jgi:hypothetical protein